MGMFYSLFFAQQTPVGVRHDARVSNHVKESLSVTGTIDREISGFYNEVYQNGSYQLCFAH